MEYEELEKKIEEMERKDMTLEEILEIVDLVHQNENVNIYDMALVMENVLYLGDDQDLLKFSKDEVRDWKAKVRWLPHDYKDKEEVKGIMIEFKKGLKVKEEEALETEEQLEEIEKADPDNNLEAEVETEKKAEAEEEPEVI